MLPRGTPHAAGGGHSTRGACPQAGPQMMCSLLQTKAPLRFFPVLSLAPVGGERKSSGLDLLRSSTCPAGGGCLAGGACPSAGSHGGGGCRGGGPRGGSPPAGRRRAPPQERPATRHPGQGGSWLKPCAVLLWAAAKQLQGGQGFFGRQGACSQVRPYLTDCRLPLAYRSGWASPGSTGAQHKLSGCSLSDCHAAWLGQDGLLVAEPPLLKVLVTFLST